MSVGITTQRVVRSLTIRQARRIALTAQGLTTPRPERPITMRDVQRQITQLAEFQIDSINVVARAQYLPLFSRLGSYDTGLLDRAAHRAPRRLFEYWAHAASLVDVTLYPALRFRMLAADEEAWGGMRRVRESHPELVDDLLQLIIERGPLTARQAERELFGAVPDRNREHWGWNWSVVKQALEWLLWSGAISSAHRNASFERAYLPIDAVLPAAIAAAPALNTADAAVELCRRAMRALGVGTDRCVADYFRLPIASARAALATLSATGEIEPVLVGQQRRPAWLAAGARAGRPRAGGTFLSPFDSMIFERQRVSWLFDFDYRIEIYVPEAKRQYGYYVYPFLFGDELVARVDLRADRRSGVLQVKGCWFEPGHDRSEVRAALAEELTLLAHWQGLERVVQVQAGGACEAAGGTPTG